MNIPPSFANMISPFNPFGRQPVGEEGQDSKESSFKAVEESAETARSENRTGEDDTHRDQVLGKQERQSSGARATSGDMAEEQSHYEQNKEQSEQRQIEQLAARDREVRAHERAHAAVGGQHTGAPQLNFVRGPDGVAYAVSGEVSVNLASVSGDPRATLRKAEQIQAAALAPADPSSQDRLIAAKAARMAEQARADIRSQELDSQRLEEQARAESQEQRAAEAEQREAAKAEREERQAVLAQRENERQRNVDLNQKLIKIGVQPATRSPGELLDQTV
ncbi:putative metalloprotease CJM1_0395 family protein [Simiduia curdlanivorans]|uniref:Metalloprotease CJM1_0395 family protein n=1 Tax=Simiduia curdlanivorans TaxID=1492769 RepID=A0ABV8V0W2_9GAMM|nr:putative metalloprotease CJM1_0395 family protein [Simiduia curdlanivorans]MDN3637618.1 putative metalloprotease CJM1_0395 family protein [Simiduia curdlanivorans]